MKLVTSSNWSNPESESCQTESFLRAALFYQYSIFGIELEILDSRLGFSFLDPTILYQRHIILNIVRIDDVLIGAMHGEGV